MELFKCVKCDHEWLPRVIGRKPVQCPRCKTYKWEAADGKA